MRTDEIIAPPHLIYPGTYTLVNKFGRTDSPSLHALEKYLSALQQSRFLEHAAQATYNLAYLQEIHRVLFADIYEWAGKIRDYNITKGNTYFCPAVLYSFLCTNANF